MNNQENNLNTEVNQSNISENNLNTGVNQNSQNNAPLNNNNNKKANKKFLIMGIVIAILLIISVVLVINILTPDVYYIDDDDVVEETNNNVSDNNAELKACDVKPIAITGNSEARKAINKMGWTMKGWYYYYGSISSNQFDTYLKVSTALYNLGYFENDAYNQIDDSCNLSKEVVDVEMAKLFNNTDYNPSEFMGNNCLPFGFAFDSSSNSYLVTKADGGCGDSIGIDDKIYDEKESGNTLTFKTKVLGYGIDGILNFDSNNELQVVVEGENVPNDVDLFEKYESYANIYEWTFVKKNGEYVFDNIKKLK